MTTIVESANKDIKIIINAGDPGFSKYSQQDICKAYADVSFEQAILVEPAC